MENLTMEELLQKGNEIVQVLLKDKGYTSTSLDFIAVRKDYVNFHVNAYDDFQEGLDYNDRYQNGGLAFNLDEIEQKLMDHPGRSKREFKVLRKRLAGIGQFSDKLVSLAGKAFFEELATTLRKYDLIEDQSRTYPTNPVEEIPF